MHWQTQSDLCPLDTIMLMCCTGTFQSPVSFLVTFYYYVQYINFSFHQWLAESKLQKRWWSAPIKDQFNLSWGTENNSLQLKLFTFEQYWRYLMKWFNNNCQLKQVFSLCLQFLLEVMIDNEVQHLVNIFIFNLMKASPIFQLNQLESFNN